MESRLCEKTKYEMQMFGLLENNYTAVRNSATNNLFLKFQIFSSFLFLVNFYLYSGVSSMCEEQLWNANIWTTQKRLHCWGNFSNNNLFLKFLIFYLFFCCTTENHYHSLVYLKFTKTWYWYCNNITRIGFREGEIVRSRECALICWLHRWWLEQKTDAVFCFTASQNICASQSFENFATGQIFFYTALHDNCHLTAN